GGDSGSLIEALAEFVALLTGGTGSTESSDITYGARCTGSGMMLSSPNSPAPISTLTSLITRPSRDGSPFPLVLCDSFSFLGVLFSAYIGRGLLA
ncbi:hypothetical protein E4T56_gene6084, partial [Termitomyces sp. T112]